MRVFKRLLAGAALLVLLFVLWLGFVWPPPFWYRTHFPRRTAFMAMRERQARQAGTPATRDYQPVAMSEMSQWLGRSAIAGEDDAFYQHHGIDWHAIREAMGYRRAAFDWSNPRDVAELRRAMGNAAARRDRLRGASTITQQLAKNLYLSPSRNPLRKLKEAVLAYQLEWSLPKDRILELYLNVAEMGPGLWGVEAASRRYFDRSAARLSMDQAALLIATLPHPLTSNPALRPGRTRWRAALILRKLRGEDIIVPQEPEEVSVPPAIAPAAPVDSLKSDTLLTPNDSAAAPVPPDTTAVKPKP